MFRASLYLKTILINKCLYFSKGRKSQKTSCIFLQAPLFQLVLPSVPLQTMYNHCVQNALLKSWVQGCVSPPFLIFVFFFSAVCAGCKLMLMLCDFCVAHSWPFHVLTSSSLSSLHSARRRLAVPRRAGRARRTGNPRLTGHPRGTSYTITAFPAIAGFAWFTWKSGCRSKFGSTWCGQYTAGFTTFLALLKTLLKAVWRWGSLFNALSVFPGEVTTQRDGYFLTENQTAFTHL